jgi:group I intron endonuclease
MICGIYKITSPTNRVYIGQSVNINKRWCNYKGLHCKDQSKLYNSFKKYGFNNHTFEVIEECIFEMLNIKERYWQEYYDVIGPNGLNCKYVKTDEKYGLFSDEVKRKISKANKGKQSSMLGRKHSDETKIKMSETHKKNKHKRIFLGFRGKHSDEAKIKMSNAKKGKPAKNKLKITLNQNIIFNSITEASAITGVGVTSISNNLSGRSKSTKIGVWNYL